MDKTAEICEMHQIQYKTLKCQNMERIVS